MHRKIAFVLIGVVACLHGAISTVNGAPVFGEQFELSQPDGTTVSVRVWGDEFYRVIETLDGYTVVRDPVSGIACYAELSADGNDLVSTGASISDPIPPNLVLDQSIRINPAAALERANATRAALAAASPALRGSGPVVPPCTGNVTGILLLIDFVDDPATIPAYQFDSFCNQIGYTGYGNNGSVRDYFYDVSDGNLVYTNYVVPTYHRASQPRSYYEDQNIEFGERARELISEALMALDNQGFDFSQYDSNGDGYVDAVNCFIAGDWSPDWAQGLWPHAGWMWLNLDGISTARYQMTSISTYGPTLRTFCHENGHMLCHWPDLYDYGDESYGLGAFGFMAAGGTSFSPIEPCAYCKVKAGWANVMPLVGGQIGVTVSSGTNTVCRFNHPLRPNEYFLLENRQKTGRDALLPDEGLAIWHIDENGSNNNEQMTPELHYRVTLVQADGNWDLENKNNTGDSQDLWGDQQYSYVFNPATTPSSAWWHEDGAMFLTSISVPGPIMTFNFYHNYQDCNGNGVPDIGEIASGEKTDCDESGLPDDCEMGGNDCDNNGIYDPCELDDNDCNGNGTLDECDIASGDSPDEDSNSVPDECQPDCNGNFIPDSWDLAMGNSLDIDANNIPDECEHVVFVDGGSQAIDPQGTSWNDAFSSLQEGLAKAQADANLTEVWVASERYFADELYQTISFVIDSNAAVYGGFRGDETRRDERDWRENETYLDGNDGEWPQACHVVEITGDAILDGFFIVRGYATNACSGDGGGVYCHPGTSSTLRHCVFYGNQAAGRGGAVYVGDAITRIDNCYFDWNHAEMGGGVYLDGPSQPLPGAESESWITNSLIHRNYADTGLGGGGIYHAGGTVNVIASIIFDNYGRISLDAEGQVSYQDNIALGSCGVSGSSVAWSEEQLQANPGMPVPFVMSVKDSYVVREGLFDDDLLDALVFDLDNVLSEASGPGIVRQSGHRCHLTPDSVCIDAAKSYTAQAVGRDLSGNARTVIGRDSMDVDMGAHEYVPNEHWTQDCSNHPEECERDCNNNGVLDLYDITGSTSQDINANSIPDECEPDCNDNGKPDSYDVREDGWADVDNNEVPDSCQPDCNHNDIPDTRDFAMGNTFDCNNNGIPDSCDTQLTNVFEDSCESLVNWQSYHPNYVAVDSGTLDGNAVRIRTAKDERRGMALLPSTGVDLNGAGTAVFEFDWQYVPSGGGWGSQYCPARVVLSYEDGGDWVDFAATSYGYVLHNRTHFEVEIPSDVFSSNFELMLSAELDGDATCTAGDSDSSVWIDNLEVSRAEYVDCDGNGVPDVCDLSEETHSDCNENGIPDQCDIDSESSRDADFNNIPDECEHVIYVDIDAATGGDGTSWSRAFKDFQDGLDAARADAAGDQQIHAIWIAEGTYTPTQDPAERGESFTIDVDGLHVLGGFAGNETRDDQRDWVDHVTILSGDINTSNDSDSYHVVVLDADAVIGGVTIQGGNANGIESQTDQGGGVLCTAYTIPAIHHCIVTGNSAKYGGGICVANAHAMISDCLVYDNTATEKGGGIYLDDQVQNTPGGLTTSRVICCTISDNHAANGGGGIYHTDGNVLVEDCIVFGNTFDSPHIADEIRLGSCSVHQLQIPGQPATSWSPLFTMTVKHSNTHYYGVVDEDPSDSLVIDCDSSVSYFDPRFTDPSSGDYHLAPSSMCVDTGHTAWGNSVDLDGNTRLVVGRDALRIDMGAYEYDPDLVWTGDCNLNVIADNVDITSGTSLDCDVNGYPDECECDCNSNGVADLCDITTSTSLDCNDNNVPDECEPDCNNNGTADSCDIDNEVSSDVNWNGIPDECDPDCNTNSIPDDRDFAMGVSQDCNESNIPDECEIAASTSGDCNLNGIPDECDIADGTGADTNNNGTPDECEDAPPALTNAVSEKVHGSGLTAVTRGIAEGGVECRRDGVTTVKLSFDKRAKASDGTNFSVSNFELSRGTITNISSLWSAIPPYDGSITLTISGVNTPGLLTIAFTAENTIGVEDSYDVCWTYVPGDVDADGDVDDDDLKAMEDVYKLPRGSSTFRYDLDLDNVIEANPGEDDYLTLSSSNPTAQQTMCNN